LQQVYIPARQIQTAVSPHPLKFRHMFICTYLLGIVHLDWLATGKTRKNLGLNCIGPFVRRLCLFSSVIYRGTRTAPSVRPPRGRASNRSGRSVRPPRGRAPNRSGRMEPSISEEGKLRARNDQLNFVLSIRLPRNRKRFLTCRKSPTRDSQLYFPSEGRHA
jgi:hypothetical protein